MLPNEVKEDNMYDFISDPGHGWLRVTRTELNGLGIADQISSCSYQKGQYVYLEEDCDAPVFEKAWEAKHKRKLHDEIDFRYVDRTPIRGYASYNKEVEQ